MPAGAYLLMALEATRQLLVNRECDASSLCLTNVKLELPLPLSVFSKVDSAVEIQLIARQMDAPEKFGFEIFSQGKTDTDSWTKHCSGCLETRDVSEPSCLSSPNQKHDQALMDQARALEPTVGAGLNNLNLNPEGSSGDFRSHEDDLENYSVDPSTLNSILRLPPMSLSSQSLPAEYRLSSLASLTVSSRSERLSCGHFTTSVEPSEMCFVESDCQIRQSKKVMLLKGMRHQAVKVAHQKPAMNSLFFKAVLLPDITTLSAAKPMSISRCVELLTHKWPSCDVRIQKIPERYIVSILEAFDATNCEARSHFRSIKCSSIPSGVFSDRVQLVDDSDKSNGSHMIITQDVNPGLRLSDQLRPGGVLCFPKVKMQDLKSNQSGLLEAICDITGFGSDPWVLLRSATIPAPVCMGRRLVIFTTKHELPAANGRERTESVELQPAAIANFCKQNNNARFDAIIIDCPANPVITAWTGSELVPWFQTLLTFAESILWVTPDRAKSPFSHVAGSLLRTLQSEQPSLKVSWLAMHETASRDQREFATHVKHAYERMIGREGELVRIADGSEEKILRYLPDDHLSTHAGLSLPHRVQSPLGRADYSLRLAAPGSPVILSYKESDAQPLSRDAIEIGLEASLIDTDDLQIFNRDSAIELSRPCSGLFFAGRVLNSCDPELPFESHVVGWHPNHLHCKKLSTQRDNICLYPDSMQPSEAASKYAAMAVAFCIVDGAARARRGETFHLAIHGPLRDAIKVVCRNLGASVLDSFLGLKVDFFVTCRSFRDICVNERPIDIAGYLHSNHRRAVVQRGWLEEADLSLKIDEYEIANYDEAFNNVTQPYSTVLLHRNTANIANHVPIYKAPATILTSCANYIVIGGLGGLGRFICSWMLDHGARHITIISRSGSAAQESQDAISAMNASGASVRCIQADARDRETVSHILANLRSERPIKGIINLAMVLGDASIAGMTGEEWDRVMRVKIDSSWILHEETLGDRLDFFILFSSIASVLGNRNQGNYNVANACLNALAEYRQELDLPGISVALGAMSKSLQAFFYPTAHRNRSS